jgi:hypothetical protein
MKKKIISILFILLFILLLILSCAQTRNNRFHKNDKITSNLELYISDTCLIDTNKYNKYLEYGMIDTVKFYNLLKDYKIYEDFKNKRWNEIDIDIFDFILKSSLERNWVTLGEEISSEEMVEDDLTQEKGIPLSPSPIFITTGTNPLKNQQDKGNLTYVINDTMELGKIYNVDLTLSKGITQKQLIHIIDGFKNKEIIDTLINITPVMRARLLSPNNNFKIKSVTDSVQNTTYSDLIRWQWQVIPLIEGDNYLTISVDIYIDNLPQSINIYNGKTYVYAYHTWHGDLWKWIEKYWTYITYAIGGMCTIVVFFYKEKIINLFKRKDIK